MRNDVIAWLLEENNPAVRYRTLTGLLGETASAEPVWNSKPILNLLRKRDENGLWSEKDYGVHTPLRYLTTLAEFGLARDPRIDAFADWSVTKLTALTDGDPAGCASGLTLRALVMLGYHERGDVARLIDNFAAAQLYDGGYMCRRLLDKRPERKSCYRAALAGLLLFAECRRRWFSPRGSDALLDYFLRRKVFFSSDGEKSLAEGRFGWRLIDNFFPVEPMRIGLPLIVNALVTLGADGHPSVEYARGLLNEKRLPDGKFPLDGTMSKQPCSFGKPGQPNKWVTLYALGC